MIAVAIAATMLGGSVLFKQRHDSFFALVQYHTSQRKFFGNKERAAKDSIRRIEACITAGDKMARGDGARSILLDNSHLISERASMIEAAAYWKRATAFHADMFRKYSYAARHPWFPLEPDPPLPSRPW